MDYLPAFKMAEVWLATFTNTWAPANTKSRELKLNVTLKTCKLVARHDPGCSRGEIEKVSFLGALFSTCSSVLYCVPAWLESLVLRCAA